MGDRCVDYLFDVLLRLLAEERSFSFTHLAPCSQGSVAVRATHGCLVSAVLRQVDLATVTNRAAEARLDVDRRHDGLVSPPHRGMERSGRLFRPLQRRLSICSRTEPVAVLLDESTRGAVREPVVLLHLVPMSNARECDLLRSSRRSTGRARSVDAGPGSTMSRNDDSGSHVETCGSIASRA
jgi:hypothetical protein